MAIKADELKITVDLDEFTWGDLADIQSSNVDRLMDVCERLMTIEGVARKDTRATLRQINVRDVYKIIDVLTQAIAAQTNPVDETGKN